MTLTGREAGRGREQNYWRMLRIFSINLYARRRKETKEKQQSAEKSERRMEKGGGGEKFMPQVLLLLRLLPMATSTSLVTRNLTRLRPYNLIPVQDRRHSRPTWRMRIKATCRTHTEPTHTHTHILMTIGHI